MENVNTLCHLHCSQKKRLSERLIYNEHTLNYTIKADIFQRLKCRNSFYLSAAVKKIFLIFHNKVNETIESKSTLFRSARKNVALLEISLKLAF